MLRSLLLAFACLFLPSCPSDDGGKVTVTEGELAGSLPPPMSSGTLLGLGSHVWVGSLEVRGDGSGRVPSRDLTSKLSWIDIDRYELLVADEDGVREHEIRLLGQRWRRNNTRAAWILTEAPPPEGLRLMTTLALADESLGQFRDQIAWQQDGEELVDGRNTVRWTLGLAPAPLIPVGLGPALSPTQAAIRQARTCTPIDLRGTVWVDVTTGNRLRAEWAGRFLPFGLRQGEVLDEVTVSYSESRTFPSEAIFIGPPTEGKIVDRSAPMPPMRPTPPGTRPPHPTASPPERRAP